VFFYQMTIAPFYLADKKFSLQSFTDEEK